MFNRLLGIVVGLVCVVAVLVSCTKAQSIEGIWIKYEGDRGAYSYNVFREDGTWVSGSWMPASSTLNGAEMQVKGTYAIDGSDLTTSGGAFFVTRVQLDGSVETSEADPWPKDKFTLVWISDDEITLKSEAGDSESYVRVAEFPTELRMKLDDS